MTLQDLIQTMAEHPWSLIAVLSAPPLLSWLAGLLHARREGSHAPWRYVYAVLVYLACVPGIFASVLTGYALLFRNDNMLEVDILVYALPIITMAVTLVLIRRNAEFDRIPGFERLSGLVIMIAVSFVGALAIRKTRIFLFFGGSLVSLLLFTAVLFVLLKWGATMALGRDRDSP